MVEEAKFEACHERDNSHAPENHRGHSEDACGEMGTVYSPNHLEKEVVSLGVTFV
jgi:hypothetical protein